MGISSRTFFLSIISTFLLSWTLYASPRIIDGIKLDPTKHRNVVTLNFNGSVCSGTIIGPRVVLTAAHCAPDRATSEVTVQGKEKYSVTIFQSPFYDDMTGDFDIALGISETPFLNVSPLPIPKGSFIINKGADFGIMGYGCEQSSTMNIGTLRGGEIEVTEAKTNVFAAKGSALCMGDSGGPAVRYDYIGCGLQVVGVGTAVDSQFKTSYFARLDTLEANLFFKQFVSKFKAKIAGYNM